MFSANAGIGIVTAKKKTEPNVQKWGDPEEALRQASNNDLYRFLGWSLKLKRGKNGRRNKGIHKSSSLNTDWKNLRGYYQKLTKSKIDDIDGSEVRRVSSMNHYSFDLFDRLV